MRKSIVIKNSAKNKAFWHKTSSIWISDSMSDAEPTETPVEPLDASAAAATIEPEPEASPANIAPDNTVPESVDGAVGGTSRPATEPRLIPPETVILF